MLNARQTAFRNIFLSPLKQRFYFLKHLPMAALAGVKLIFLDEEKAVAIVPFMRRNKNPFKSMYFAVQSMAAELSTASLAMLALKSLEADVALIITENRAEFNKKAQTEISFTCVDYSEFKKAFNELKNAGDTTSVTAKTIGTNSEGEEVAVFYFTWSFKRRN